MCHVAHNCQLFSICDLMALVKMNEELFIYVMCLKKHLSVNPKIFLKLWRLLFDRQFSHLKPLEKYIVLYFCVDIFRAKWCFRASSSTAVARAPPVSVHCAFKGVSTHSFDPLPPKHQPFQISPPSFTVISSQLKGSAQLWPVGSTDSLHFNLLLKWEQIKCFLPE